MAEKQWTGVGNAEDRSSSTYNAKKKVETIRESAPHLRYLVVVIDARMTLQEHLNRASERAMKAIFALSRIMSNIDGPRYTKPKLLASVSSSIMLYGAPIWGQATNVPTYVAKICSSYRISSMQYPNCFIRSNILNLEYDRSLSSC